MTDVIAVLEGEPFVLKSRERLPSGEYLVASDVSVAEAKVYASEKAESGVLYQWAPDPATTVLAALTTDDLWPYQLGYNVKLTVPQEAAPVGGQRLLVELDLYVWSLEGTEEDPWVHTVQWTVEGRPRRG